MGYSIRNVSYCYSTFRFCTKSKIFQFYFTGLDAGSVGLSVTYAMALMALFQWCVRQSASVANQVILFIYQIYYYVPQ
jgi:hypothetical protein